MSTNDFAKRILRDCKCRGRSRACLAVLACTVITECADTAAPTATTRPTTTTRPAPPRTEEKRAARLQMVARQLAGRDIRDARVLQAMRDVPRHWFVPSGLQSAAYDDTPLPIGFSQTISQPYIVAFMTQLAEVRPGDKVLEIGTGSGYQAAVLSELTDRVFTIEIVEPLAKATIQTLKERGYGAIKPRIGDGFRGWPEEAPFDAIIVTCAPDEIPPPLLEQLAIGGRLVIPVGAGAFGQELLVATKSQDGKIERHSVLPVTFVPMTGEANKGK